MTLWSDPVPIEDDFGDPIVDEFYDGRLSGDRAWALFSPRSWLRHGCGQLGIGHGQRYTKQADGTWLKIDIERRPRWPAIHVQLTGEDGNVFAIIGRVRRALRAAHIPSAEIQKLIDDCNACDSYDAVLRLVMQTVSIL